MFGIMKAIVKLVSDNKKTKTINLQVEGMDKQIKDSELLHPSGFISKPVPNTSALTIQVSKNYSVAIAFADTNINIVNLKDGERCIYSTDKSGEIKSKIFLLSDGTIELNGNDKSFVTYKELNEGLQQLWETIKTHKHETPQGPAAPSIELATATLDISSSETTTIKTGG